MHTKRKLLKFFFNCFFLVPDDFEVVTNATAYFVSMSTSVQEDSVILNYTMFFNTSSQDTPPSLITLTLVSQLYVQELLSFDNGERTKIYISELPDSYSVDENDVASFQESILFRGEVPPLFFRDGIASLQLDLTSMIGEISSSTTTMAVTPMFVSLMQQQEISKRIIKITYNYACSNSFIAIQVNIVLHVSNY